MGWAILLTIVREVKAGFQGTLLPSHCFDYLTEKKIGFPLLLIYSKTDSCIPANDVEEVAAAQEKLGTEVIRMSFEESEHVCHLGMYKERYVAALTSFLEKVF